MTPQNPDTVLQDILDRCQEFHTPCGDGALMWRKWDRLNSSEAPVILLHGGYGSWNHWVRTIPDLETHFPVLAPDLPGCGDSAEPIQPYDAEALARIISEGLDRVTSNWEHYHLVGFSFGGLLTGLISQYQKFRILSLTIVGSPLLGLNRSGPSNQLRAVSPHDSSKAVNIIYRSNLEKLMVKHPNAIDCLAMTLHKKNMEKARLHSRRVARKLNFAETIRNLTCPLTFIYGDSDVTLFPSLHGVKDYVNKHHPKCNFHIISDTGHWVQYEAPINFNHLLISSLAFRAKKY